MIEAHVARSPEEVYGRLREAARASLASPIGDRFPVLSLICLQSRWIREASIDERFAPDGRVIEIVVRGRWGLPITRHTCALIRVAVESVAPPRSTVLVRR